MHASGCSMHTCVAVGGLFLCALLTARLTTGVLLHDQRCAWSLCKYSQHPTALRSVGLCVILIINLHITASRQV
eukprot:1253325-Amphidinium_carterae.1